MYLPPLRKSIAKPPAGLSNASHPSQKTIIDSVTAEHLSDPLCLSHLPLRSRRPSAWASQFHPVPPALNYVPSYLEDQQPPRQAESRKRLRSDSCDCTPTTATKPPASRKIRNTAQAASGPSAEVAPVVQAPGAIPARSAIPAITLFEQLKKLPIGSPEREALLKQFRVAQQVEARRFVAPGNLSPVMRARDHLDQYAAEANRLLKGCPETAHCHLTVEGNSPRHLLLHVADGKSNYAPPYLAGEKIRERITQDYWLIALKKLITGNNPSFRNFGFQECQGTYGELNGRTHMVVSGNTVQSNRLILEHIGIDPDGALGKVYTGIYTVEDFDMSSFVHQKLVPEALKATPASDRSTVRRLKKLDAFHDDHVPGKITLHILANPVPHGHAEVAVQAAAVALKLNNIRAPRGTKTNCLGCAVKLTQMGVDNIDGGTRRIYSTNMVTPAQLQQFLKNRPDIVLTNKFFDPRTERTSTGLRRRMSTSPEPRGARK